MAEISNVMPIFSPLFTAPREKKQAETEIWDVATIFGEALLLLAKHTVESGASKRCERQIVHVRLWVKICYLKGLIFDNFKDQILFVQYVATIITISTTN